MYGPIKAPHIYRVYTYATLSPAGARCLHACFTCQVKRSLRRCQSAYESVCPIPAQYPDGDKPAHDLKVHRPSIPQHLLVVLPLRWCASSCGCACACVFARGQLARSEKGQKVERPGRWKRHKWTHSDEGGGEGEGEKHPCMVFLS